MTTSTHASLTAVLLDLDDTLLDNDMARFGPAYLESLGRLLAPRGAVDALRGSIEAVIREPDLSQTNDERFWRELSERTGQPTPYLHAVFARFCEEGLPELRSLTRPRREAPTVVRLARARGLKVVLATNPMFPPTVTLQRIEWAGLRAGDFDHITLQDCAHACKPHPAYFREALSAVGAEPESALMVGDDWRLDIAPAMRLGLRAYWIRRRDASRPGSDLVPDASGAWEEFVDWWKAW